VDVGIVIAQTVHRLYPTHYALEKLHPLLRDRATLDGIKAGKSLAEIKKAWAEPLQQFRERRERYLIYR
jgi:hypothetical protein